MALARIRLDTLIGLDFASNVTVEVRDEATSALVGCYSDRAGTVSIGNPFVVADGQIGFHCQAGAFKIVLTSGANTRTLRYVKNGLGAEMDGAGDMISTNNLSDVASVMAAHDNIVTQGADIASAVTVDLDAATGSCIAVTGTVPITTITLSNGRSRTIRCVAALPITAGANLQVNGANTGTFTFQPGDLLTVLGFTTSVSVTKQTSGAGVDDNALSTEITLSSSGNIGFNNVAPAADKQIHYIAKDGTKRAYFLKTNSNPSAVVTEPEGFDNLNTMLTVDGFATSVQQWSGGSIHGKLVAGQNSSFKGTVTALAGNSQIHDITNDASANCEFSSFLGIVNAWKASTVTANTRANLWGIDLNVFGPETGQEGYLAGLTNLVNKYQAGTTIDATHFGAIGAAIITAPGQGGGKDEGQVGMTTYPLDAGLIIVGFSGPVDGANAATSGSDVDATNAFNTALQIGGRGSGWMPGATASSKMGTGINITDWVDYGIHISGRHGTGTGPAIATAEAAGPVGFGTITPVGQMQLSSGSAETKLQISNTATDGDPKLVLEVSGATAWQMGVDDSDGDKWKLANQATTTWARTALIVDTGGKLSVNVAVDGSVLDFQSGGVTQGNVSVAGATVSYNAFVGSHYTQLKHGQVELPIGAVVIATGEIVQSDHVLATSWDDEIEISAEDACEKIKLPVVEFETELVKVKELIRGKKGTRKFTRRIDKTCELDHYYFDEASGKVAVRKITKPLTKAIIKQQTRLKEGVRLCDKTGKFYLTKKKTSPAAVKDYFPFISTTSTPGDKRVYGVWNSKMADTAKGNAFGQDDLPIYLISQVGLYQVRACDANGDIENGDWLETSECPMEAQRQTAPEKRNSTLGKALIDVDWSKVSVDKNLGYKWQLIPVIF